MASFLSNSLALSALHRLNYVHGDVSAGNILLVEDPDSKQERGILIDLEMSRNLTDTTSDPKTYEIFTGSNWFIPQTIFSRTFPHGVEQGILYIPMHGEFRLWVHTSDCSH